MARLHNDFTANIAGSPAYSPFSIYPNPSIDQMIYLQLKESNSQKLRTEIFNMSGQLLENNQHGIYHGGIVPISVKNLKSGIYLLKVYENDRSSVSKFKVE